MEYTRFGRTGLRVSKLCLGTMTFGLQCDEAQSHAILDTAAEGGIDFIDTANVYPLGGDRTTAGRTEEIIGRWLRGKRSQFIVATKCVGVMGPKPWERGGASNAATCMWPFSYCASSRRPMSILWLASTGDFFGF